MQKFIWIIIFLFFHTGFNLSLFASKDLDRALDIATSDLRESLEELDEIRNNIVAEKGPLLNQVAELESEVRQKQNKVNRLYRLRDNNDIGLNRLREQVKAHDQQNEYAASLLDDFVRTFESRLDHSEIQLYDGEIKEAQLTLDDSDSTQAINFEKQLNVISLAINRLNKLIGGYTFEGLGLAPNGDIIEGKFSTHGPTVYFNSKDSKIQGMVVTQINAAEAAIVETGNNYKSGLIDFIETGKGNVPLDITLGKALKIVEGNDTIFEHLAKGGLVGIVIILLGFICLIIGIYKALEINRCVTPTKKEVFKITELIESGNKEEALKLAQAIPSEGGDLLITAVQNCAKNSTHLEEILYEKIITVQPKIERFLPFMALTAAASPLLGLLGTVTGMIKTFTLITIFGTGDAKSLSSGISEALVTTELGLIVAIPSLILHGLLSRLAKQKIGELEQVSICFINAIIVNKSSNSK